MEHCTGKLVEVGKKQDEMTASLATTKNEKGLDFSNPLIKLVRPERFERPTPWFVAKYSIQLSYGRKKTKTDYNKNTGGEGGIRTLDKPFEPMLP